MAMFILPQTLANMYFTEKVEFVAKYFVRKAGLSKVK